MLTHLIQTFIQTIHSYKYIYHFKCRQSFTIYAKLVGKVIATTEEHCFYIKVDVRLGCSVNVIFAEITCVLGPGKVSYNTVQGWKREI